MNKIITILLGPIIALLLFVVPALAHHGEGEGVTSCRATAESPWTVNWTIRSQHWKDYWRIERSSGTNEFGTSWKAWNENFTASITYPASQSSASLTSSGYTGRWDDNANINGSVTGAIEISSVPRPGLCPVTTTPTTTTTTTTIPVTTTTTTIPVATTSTTTTVPVTTTTSTPETTTTLPSVETVPEETTTTTTTTIVAEITEPPTVPPTEPSTVAPSTLPPGTSAPIPTAASVSVVPVEELPATGNNTDALGFMAGFVLVTGVVLLVIVFLTRKK